MIRGILAVVAALVCFPMCAKATTIDLVTQEYGIPPAVDLNIGDSGHLLGIYHFDLAGHVPDPLRVWQGIWYFTLPLGAELIVKINGIKPEDHEFSAFFEFRWNGDSKFALLPDFDASASPQDEGAIASLADLGIIDFSGQIVTPNFDQISFDATYTVVSYVPLPAALPLFAGAIGGLGLIRWRRKAAA